MLTFDLQPKEEILRLKVIAEGLASEPSRQPAHDEPAPGVIVHELNSRDVLHGVAPCDVVLRCQRGPGGRDSDEFDAGLLVARDTRQ